MAYKLLLKELDVTNVSQNYCNWLNDYEVTKFTEQKYFKHNLNSVKKFVKNKKMSKNEYLYGIFIYKNNKKVHIGNIKIGPINFRHKYTEISYFIGNRHFWGLGIGTLAIKKILLICKRRFKLKKIVAGCYENNLGSIKILKKNNFKKEATLKKHIIFEKKRIDQYIFGKVI
tara:strand:+ start:392 stop:907 length:516 start_codon:yes stop_codon:yes gene_type:complete